MLRTTETITTDDFWQLTIDVLTPNNPIGVVVAGHAMMVNRKTLDRPRGSGLASKLAEAGFAVIVPDLRGRGDSGPSASKGGRWTYDDLVEHDAPALLQFARKKFPGLKVSLLGHSLFGHVSSAFAGISAQPPEALVLLAVNVWLPRFEPSYARWLTKRATMEALLPLSRRFGYCPSKKVGFGSEDEALDYFEQFLVWARTGTWFSNKGEDYLKRLPKYRGSVLSIVGAADTLNCRPECALHFAQHFGGTLDFRIVGKKSGLSFDPGHMELTTDPRSEPVWSDIAVWLKKTLAR
jgi:predicted alpha/beta hydrolase